MRLMKIINDRVLLKEIKQMSSNFFGDMVKAVVDVNREVLAVNSELHSDLEALLLEDGSSQKDLWGINLYPAMSTDDFVEFDSMINIRPGQNNMSRGVDDEKLQDRIKNIVGQRIER